MKIYSQISCLYMMTKTCDNLCNKKLHSGGLPASKQTVIVLKLCPIAMDHKRNAFVLPIWFCHEFVIFPSWPLQINLVPKVSQFQSPKKALKKQCPLQTTYFKFLYAFLLVLSTCFRHRPVSSNASLFEGQGWCQTSRRPEHAVKQMHIERSVGELGLTYMEFADWVTSIQDQYDLQCNQYTMHQQMLPQHQQLLPQHLQEPHQQFTIHSQS